tara:strand:- start:1101 stop:1865 length:765 start_codon:yes stop_codon:yes gene_type:complete
MSYKRSKYFTTSNKRKIKHFILNNKSKITVVFFHGFMSDMIGAKPKAIQRFCSKHKLNFLKFEYSGHGKSSGKFTEGNISKWTNDAKQLIKAKVKKDSNLIFVGSSMGSWVALKLIKKFKKKINGFIGISSAPEFLDRLMWRKFNKKIKKKIIKEKFYNLQMSNSVYPLTKQLIWDGRKNKILNKKILFKIRVTLFHSLRDEVVPLKFSKMIFKIFPNSSRKLIKIKDGNHSLSRKRDLKKICSELNNIISKKD